jgi:hypothetical protein
MAAASSAARGGAVVPTEARLEGDGLARSLGGGGGATAGVFALPVPSPIPLSPPPAPLFLLPGVPFKARAARRPRAPLPARRRRALRSRAAATLSPPAGTCAVAPRTSSISLHDMHTCMA